MKIRSDYVTNSSSSSFILSFKDEDSIYDTLKEQFPKNIKSSWSAGEQGYFDQLLDEIRESRRLTKDNVQDIAEYEYYYDKEGCEKAISKIMDKIGDNKVIVEVEHGDGGEGEDGILEYEILPNLDCTVVRFSHH